MFCPKCGAQNENGAKFCAACGSDMTAEATVSATPAPNAYAPAGDFTPLENPITEPEKPKKNLKPIILGVAAVAVIAIVIALIAGLFGGGSKYIESPNKFMAITEDGDEVTVYYNRKEIGTYKPEDGDADLLTTNMLYDPDPKVPAWLVTIDKKSVALITNKEITVIDEKMDNAWISSDAKTILFTVYKEDNEDTPDKDESTIQLKSYNVKDETTVDITDDLRSTYDVSTSLDCKSAIFNKYNSDKEKEELWLYNDGDAARLINDMEPLGVSNKAKYIYTSGKDSKGETCIFIVDKDGEKTKIKGEYIDGSFVSNRDGDEILFRAGESLWTCVGGDAENAVSLFKTSTTELIVPAYKSIKYDTFKGQVISGDKGAYLIANLKNGEVYKLCDGNASSLQLSADGSYLYYIDTDDDDDKLMRVKVAKNAEAEELVGEGVDEFVLTSDKKVYFIADEELRLYGKKKNERVAADVTDLGITAKNLVWFIGDEETTYFVKGKTDKERLGDDIGSIYSNVAYSYYKKDTSEENGSATIMISNGNSKFEQLVQDSYVGSGVTVDVPYSVRKPSEPDED